MRPMPSFVRRWREMQKGERACQALVAPALTLEELHSIGIRHRDGWAKNAGSGFRQPAHHFLFLAEHFSQPKCWANETVNP